MLNTILSSKHLKLEAARTELKNHFFGIDEVIDQIIDSLKSWYFFPEFQSRPLVINLWGMTGVGKTDLVKQLVKLLEWENDFFSFDCGEFGSKSTGSIRNILHGKVASEASQPTILLFDEFQLAKTISRDGQELDYTESRAIWQLLDDGKLSFFYDWYYREGQLQNIFNELSFRIKNGLKIQNGTVSERDKSFLETKYAEKRNELSSTHWKSFISIPKNRFVFNEDDMEAILEATNFEYGDKSMIEVKIRTMDGVQILAFLKELIDLCTKPKLINLSNAVIFVLGNLDEVYSNSNDLSSDLSPDTFHLNSKKISVSDIKRSLQRHFRPEQIARLGNNHIIYPSLNSKAYLKIIEKSLRQIEGWVKIKSGIDICFTNSISEWIFDEAIIPSQGVRPVKSTIRYAIEDQIPILLLDTLDLDKSVDRIIVGYSSSSLSASFWANNQNILEKRYTVAEKTTPLKSSRRDDLQAVAAVHESGHAILLMACIGKIPNQILSVASQSGVSGLVNFESEIILSPHALKNRISILLAGFEAERLIFGNQKVTDGSSEDIQVATDLAMRLLKNSGFGNKQAQFAISAEDFSYSLHSIKEIEKEAEKIIEEASEFTRELLRKEKYLLLEMGTVLADKPSLNPTEIKSLLEEFGTSELNNSIAFNRTGYRETLFESLNSFRAGTKNQMVNSY